MEIYQLLLGLFTAIVVIKLWSKIIKHIQFRLRVNKLPSPKVWPLLGLSVELASVEHEDTDELFTNIAQQFKDGLFMVWLGTEPFVHISKPRHYEIVLPSTTLITKSKAYEVFSAWLGQGLLTSTGELWFNHRRLITPAFHFGVLEQFIGVINEKVDILNEIFEEEISANPNKPIEICQYVAKCTLDIICETSMGVNMNAQRDTSHLYTSSVHRFSTLTSDRFIWPWNMWDPYYRRTKAGKELYSIIKIMHEYTDKLITQKKNAWKQAADEKSKEVTDKDNDVGVRKRRAFLDLLLEESEKAEHPMTAKEIREHVDTFMFAGHDTTTAAISWGLFALGNAPEVQEKLRNEIFEVLGDDDKITTSKKLSELKYLDRVIKEVLRLYPSVPFVSRHVTHDIQIDGYTIPAGSTIQINIMLLHRDPEVWEDPLKFDPDRFHPDRIKNKHPYSYIPFSAGPRNCIGQKFALMELKLTFVSLLRKWRIKSVKKHEEMKTCSDLILRPAKGIDLYLTHVSSTQK